MKSSCKFFMSAFLIFNRASVASEKNLERMGGKSHCLIGNGIFLNRPNRSNVNVAP